MKIRRRGPAPTPAAGDRRRIDLTGPGAMLPAMTQDHKRFSAIAAAIYGREWRPLLAETLGVAFLSVQRWSTGYSRIPPGVWRDLEELAAEHTGETYQKDRELFAAIAAALYGEGWRSPLARTLGVAVKTVQRWETGFSRIPAPVWPDLQRLMAERAEALAGFGRLLAERQQPQSPENSTVSEPQRRPGRSGR